MMRLVLLGVSLVMGARAGLECTICEAVMKHVDGDFLDLNASSVIEKACDRVPDVLHAREACVAEATKVAAKTLNDTVATALDPANACKCLGYCDGAAARAAVGIDLGCDVCKGITYVFDDVLESNATRAKLESQIASACGVLPFGADTCDALFDGKVEGMLACEAAGPLAPATFCAATGRCA